METIIEDDETSVTIEQSLHDDDRKILDFLSNVKNRHQRQVAELANNLDTKNTQLNRVQREKDLLRNKLDKQTRFLPNYESSLTDSRHLLQTLAASERDSIAKQATIDHLRHENSDIMIELNRLRHENERYKLENERSADDVKRLTKENQDFVRSIETMKNAYRTLESQTTKFRQLYKQSTESFTMEKKLFDDERIKLQCRLSELCGEIKQLEIKVHQLEHEKKQLNKDIEKTRDSVDDLQCQVSRFNKDLLRERTQRLQCETRQAQHIYQIQQLNDDKSVLSEKNADFEKQIRALKEERSQLITRVNSLSSQDRKLSEGLERSLAHCDDLQRRIDCLMNEIDERKNQFNIENIKKSEQIKQQLKLIDLLRESIPRIDDQRKSWFGSSSTKSLLSLFKHQPNSRECELENELHRERVVNQELKEQLYDASREIRRYQDELRNLIDGDFINSTEKKLNAQRLLGSSAIAEFIYDTTHSISSSNFADLNDISGSFRSDRSHG